jgi:hypothetical protein
MMTQLQVGEFLRTLTNPRYTEANHQGSIVLDGIYNGQILPFYASPIDAMEYGRNIYERAINGDFGPIGDYVQVTLPEELPDPKIPQMDLFSEVEK